MKKQKTWISVSLLLIALLLAACAGKQAAPPEETTEITPAPAQTETPADYSGKLRVSELMVKNRATLADAAGGFPDWIELENVSGETLPLGGWQLRDGENAWAIPEMELAPGNYLLLLCNGELGPGFSLSEGETLCLLSPDGTEQDSAACEGKADRSLIRQEDGGFTLCLTPSPGYPNTPEGYEAACSRRGAAALCIGEAAVANSAFTLPGTGETSDWVELRNSGAGEIALAGYTLTDDAAQPDKYPLPDRVLAPGECLLLACEGDLDASDGNTGFSLSASGERLYLYDPAGALLDYVYLHDIPAGGSMGRMEGAGGFFYFAAATPGEANGIGARRVSAMPTALTPDGCYDGVDGVTVELAGEGLLRYTLDGSVPDENAAIYTGPIRLEKTGVIRAVAWEDGALPSAAATFSYILNENHTLPVLSLVVDQGDEFQTVFRNGWKNHELSANLALYDGEHSFNHPCGMTIKGWTSLNLDKKSLGVSFKGAYGGNLACDVFGNGVTEFSTLAIRAGQDYTFSIFRNELMQDLCLEGSDSLYTQASKWCILYVNGEYYGIYCLKEDFSRQYYASHAGVSKDSATVLKTPVGPGVDFYDEVVTFAWYNDLSTPENYSHVCDYVDIDSLIDWFLFESYCANTDTQGNCRIMRSSENGNKWAFGFYDLDWGFWYSGSDFGVLLGGFGNAGSQMPPLLRGLMANQEFRSRCLARFAELNSGVLSNEHVLAKIDEYEALLEPEAARDRERWGLNLQSWHEEVEGLRRFIIDNNWEKHNIDQLCLYGNISREEREQYFGTN